LGCSIPGGGAAAQHVKQKPPKKRRGYIMKKVLLFVSALAVTSSVFCTKDTCTTKSKKYIVLIDQQKVNNGLKKLEEKFKTLSYEEQENIRNAANAALTVGVIGTVLTIAGASAIYNAVREHYTRPAHYCPSIRSNRNEDKELATALCTTLSISVIFCFLAKWYCII